MPTWLAPNVLTFSGFLFLVLQFALLAYYDADFYASADNFPDHPVVPRWMWLASAICLFMAHTLGTTFIYLFLSPYVCLKISELIIIKEGSQEGLVEGGL